MSEMIHTGSFSARLGMAVWRRRRAALPAAALGVVDGLESRVLLSTINTIASFDPNPQGAGPQSTPVLDAGGNLYGTTFYGGEDNVGTIFEIANGSNTITTLASFDETNGAYPDAGLTLDGSGNLYGTSDSGGAGGDGTVFEIAKGSNTITALASFEKTDGFPIYAGSLTLDGSGNLYGTTYYGGANNDGAVFEIAKGSNIITTLASFDETNGANPFAGVTFDGGGNLYGTAGSGGADDDGTVFEIANGSNTITTLASFDRTNGVNPNGGLTLDSSGNLYSTTSYGGADNAGTVFEIANGSNTITTLASFDGTNGASPFAGLTFDGSGNLYGTTVQGGADGDGTVFEIANGSNTITALASFDGTNGTDAFAGVTLDGSGNLYGTTRSGGAYNDGTVFEIANGSNTITTLASFNFTNGKYPYGGVTLDGSGNLYGTTYEGGTDGLGTVFEIAKGSNTITTLASFDESNGAYPYAGVTLDGSGNLYGTTAGGGGANEGTVFEIGKDSDTITTLASFGGGAIPYFAGVTLDGSGNLYGTTYYGGADNDGTVFKIAKGSNTITTLISFDGINGAIPYAGLTFDGSGNLYGTTVQGGANGDGTVFEIANGSNTITTLSSFDRTNGANPHAGLTLDGNGNLYGTTAGGGADGYGTVFKIAKGSNTVTTLASFNFTNGAIPFAGLTLDGNGNLYGTTTSGGAYNDGTVFKIANGNCIITSLASFDGTNGANPYAGVTLDGSGNLYGTTEEGGEDNSSGTVFELSPIVLTGPAVTGISPTSGPALGGTTVTITGTGFTGATAVDFGGTPAASFTVNSTGTQITAVDPAGSGTVDVTVVTSGGTSAISAADQFTYISLPSWLAAGSAATWNSTTDTLTVTGAATIIADPGSAEPNIVASGSAAKVTVTPATSPTDVHIGGVTLSNGASIVMSDVDATQVASGTNASNHHTDHNVLVIGTLGAVNDPTIAIDSASELDLGDNDLIVHTGSSDTGTSDVQGFTETNELKAIEVLAATGRNVAPGGVYDGTWTGNGLTSSVAATADSAANDGYEQNILAVEQNSDMYLGGYKTWAVGSASETLGANDIIVKYTYNGDLNLDGAVDGNAATIFSTFYDNAATSGNVYAYGDLNGDGKINGNDATIFSTVYGNGLAGSGRPQL